MQTSTVRIHRLDSDDLAKIRKRYPFCTRLCLTCGEAFELGDLVVNVEICGVGHLYHQKCFKKPTGRETERAQEPMTACEERVCSLSPLIRSMFKG